MMSGGVAVAAVNNSVSSPEMIGAAWVLLQVTISATSTACIGALGVSVITKVCAAPGWISTGVFGDPVT